jgi:uncharacterized membrane protein YqjE
MSKESGETPLDRDEATAFTAPGDDGMPKGWKAAFATLVSARLEMIRIEAKSASAAAVGRIALLLIMLFGLFFAWVLALVAAIGAIAASTPWVWYQVAAAAAGLHLLLAAFALLIIRASKKKTSFPVTRAEFEKDREWLNRLKNR